MTQAKQPAARRASRAAAFKTHTGAEVFPPQLLGSRQVVCGYGAAGQILRLLSFKLCAAACPCGAAVAACQSAG